MTPPDTHDTDAVCRTRHNKINRQTGQRDLVDRTADFVSALHK